MHTQQCDGSFVDEDLLHIVCLGYCMGQQFWRRIRTLALTSYYLMKYACPQWEHEPCAGNSCLGYAALIEWLFKNKSIYLPLDGVVLQINPGLICMCSVNLWHSLYWTMVLTSADLFEEIRRVPVHFFERAQQVRGHFCRRCSQECRHTVFQFGFNSCEPSVLFAQWHHVRCTLQAGYGSFEWLNNCTNPWTSVALLYIWRMETYFA